MPGETPLLLVADDDEDILLLVELRLTLSGFDVVSARDGQEALELARGRRPDLAVLDWMMPGASGVDVVRALRADDETSRLPVLLLTARAADSDVREGLAAGADDYLHKPFSPQELVERVRSLLAQASETPEL
ncbi:MAG TPA: response regulator [Gaiellaceae bacterium]|nr:response regulator [Gaiellaceae bacterium]